MPWPMQIRFPFAFLRSPSLAGVDCVVIVTEHAAYDWFWILDQATLVVDIRNALSGQTDKKVVRLYYSLEL